MAHSGAPRVTLAVDAGQTGTRAALVDGDAVGPVGRGPGVRHLYAAGGIEHVVEAVGTAAAEAGLADQRPDVVVVGLSGWVDALPGLEEFAAELTRTLGAVRVVVASDAVTSYVGALGLRPGVVVAAGTGSVILGADARGAFAFVDGWGHVLGDAGSGFAIGRAGLVSALRAFDGRGGSTELQARAEAAYGRLDLLPTAVHGSVGPARSVAAFAHAVAEAARAGDPAARDIWATAADDLAASAVAAADRALGAGTPGEVAPVGGLFAAEDLLLGPFGRRLAERAGHLRIVTPAGTSLDGARLLAEAAALEMFPGQIWASAAPVRS